MLRASYWQKHGGVGMVILEPDYVYWTEQEQDDYLEYMYANRSEEEKHLSFREWFDRL